MIKYSTLLILAFLLNNTLSAQVISTLAGANNPTSCAYDGNENLYFMISSGPCGGSQIVKINTSTGQLTIVVGSGNCGSPGGSALSTKLNYATGIAVDKAEWPYLLRGSA